jgi:hypothetical protein
MGPNRFPYHCLFLTLQTDELLGRFAITLPGFGKLDEDITMSTTTPAVPPHQAPLPSLAGPITWAHDRDLNFVMLFVIGSTLAI